jgi:phage gp36-like protein
MYATQAQLIERYGERMLVDLSDRADPPAGAINAGVVARALADTDAVIDGYLAGRYALPLAATPPQLLDLALSIAIYKLHPSEPDPKIKADYEDAKKDLLKISTGVIRLPAAGIEPAAATSSGVETIDRERELSPESLKGFI